MGKTSKTTKTASETLTIDSILKKIATCLEDLEDVAWADGFSCGREAAKSSTQAMPKGKIGKVVKGKQGKPSQ